MFSKKHITVIYLVLIILISLSLVNFYDIFSNISADKIVSSSQFLDLDRIETLISENYNMESQELDNNIEYYDQIYFSQSGEYQQIIDKNIFNLKQKQDQDLDQESFDLIDENDRDDNKDKIIEENDEEKEEEQIIQEVVTEEPVIRIPFRVIAVSSTQNDNSRAIINYEGTTETDIVKKGDIIRGFTVDEIKNKKITLYKNGQKYSLKLEGE